MTPFRLRYQTIEFSDIDIHVRTLRDNQQFNDDGGEARVLGISSATWPLFGILWDSGKVLANLMSDYDIGGKRILEVGCGIGLASLLLNHREANITATDYHPEAENFLKANVSLNEGRKIPFIRTGWADEDSGLGLFDLIVGSDILYEAGHVELLGDFINQHAQDDCEVLIVDPGRGHQGRFIKKMTALGFDHRETRPDTSAYLETPFKGRIHHYRRERNI
jgi:predicted nicotinamide N-methyase